MKRVGTVVRFAQEMLIAEHTADEIPTVGAEVVDEGLDPVGRIVDVIGPVATPLVVIDPSIDDAANLLNQRVYLR